MAKRPSSKPAPAAATAPKKHDPARVAAIVEGLAETYPVAECALIHDSPFQLLIATILSAQCTDERVNQVTRTLFAKFPTAEAMANASLTDLETEVQPTGFFRNKARNIQGCCRALVEQHGGQVPRDLEALVQLPGVGRKTANVVLGTAFGLPTGVVVDTHVTRLSQRLGMTRHDDAVKIEQDLMRLLPTAEWIMFSHRVIHHGRRVCKARKPRCEDCMLAALCPRIGVS
ncbi:MAG: Ultraviolet N-glycosylase/AP lyase [Planctomycetota bacterium]|jgi:endonuclease-3